MHSLSYLLESKASFSFDASYEHIGQLVRSKERCSVSVSEI